MTTQKLTTFKIPQIRYWRELSIIAMMCMEISWIVPWYRSLTPATYAVSLARVFLVLMGILLLANISMRVMNFLDLKISIRRGVIFILLVISVFVGLKLLLYQSDPIQVGELLDRPFKAFGDVRGIIPDEFLIIVFVLVVFWRGLSLASKYIDPISVRHNFYLGLAMFTAFIFINTLVTGETPGFMLYLFFVSALIALASARIFTITQLRGGATNPFDLPWFLGIFVTTLVTVGLAGLVAWLFSGQTSIVGAIGSLILGIFSVLMLALISPLIFLAERFLTMSPNVSGAFQNVIDVLDDLRNTFGAMANNLFNLFNIPSLLNWMQLLKPVLLWGFVIAISIAIMYSISRWLFKERYSDRDNLESIIEPGDLMRLLRQAVQNQLAKLGQILRDRSRLRSGQRWLAAAKIRRIYARLMDLCSKLDNPRPPAHTPLEFLPALEGLFPEGKEEVRTITHAYLRVRYGELPESNQEVTMVESAWERVKTMGKEGLRQISKAQRKTRAKSP
jgi:hypothetical protein